MKKAHGFLKAATHLFFVFMLISYQAVPLQAAVNRESLRQKIRDKLTAAISRFSGENSNTSSTDTSNVSGIVIQNQTGTITITTPDGQVITVEAGQPMPNIPSGSKIEVVTGSADIAAGGGNSVDVILNGSSATLTDGAAINVRVDLRTGNTITKVLSGEVTVTKPDGTTSVMAEGSEVSSQAPTPVHPDSVNTPGTDPANDPSSPNTASSGTGY